MNDLAETLHCSNCKGILQETRNVSSLRCTRCGREFPVVQGIPRFVHDEEYAANFGYQWKRFSKVQLDSYNGTNFSRERFLSISGWSSQDLGGKLVLDAGCGSGRFSEIAARCGGRVIAVDVSRAVEACRANLSEQDILVCQASIYELPFEEDTFDYVFSIGVIQHTPDPTKAITTLARMVRPGGQIALWIYELNWKSFVGTLGFKYLLRPLTTRWRQERQIAFSEGLARLFWPTVRWCHQRGTLGRVIMRTLPVASAHLHGVKLREEDLRSWVALDTFDMYSPQYDSPQRYEQIARMLSRCGFTDIRRHAHGGVSITGRKRVEATGGGSER